VVGYSVVCQEIFQSFESISFTENSIQQLHDWLLRYSDKDIQHRGYYKKLSNNVEAFDASGKSIGIVFQTASPFETPREMQELIYWTNESLAQKSLHPLLIIGIFVVIFLAIHPFQDGNGRLSRLLTTLLLLKSGYLYVPYSSLESIIERSKESYYLALRKTQASLKTEKMDFNPWLLFFLRALQKQKSHLEHKVKAEQILLELPPLSVHILSVLKDQGPLSVSNIQKITEANRHTLKKHLAELVKMRHISRIGKGRGTHYRR